MKHAAFPPIIQRNMNWGWTRLECTQWWRSCWWMCTTWTSRWSSSSTTAPSLLGSLNNPQLNCPSCWERRLFQAHISSPLEALFVKIVHLNKIWVVRKCPTFFPACYIGTWGTIDGELVGGAHWVAVSVCTAVAEVFVGHVAEGGALAGWGRGRDVEEAWVAFCCRWGPVDQKVSCRWIPIISSWFWYQRKH